ncbi:alpha/beta hydrolase [Anaeromicropila herbilytica]|uniref:Esterase n=1 Tax=Anaeromicropila herbilytica TaxID=2785025 RepID=A0A7R7EPL5_9FIRM|nr:alpha/beta hydrolase-fold protein [Anaeromicropila herbilytica]BCN32683.1 hypothetical protein bsdtb5_39780 [Anaeromicropila herbilytica]
MKVVILLIVFLLLVTFIVGVFVISRTKTARKRITTWLALGLLMCIVVMTESCSHKNNKQKEEKQVNSENAKSQSNIKSESNTKNKSNSKNESNTESENNKESENTSDIKLKIGETEQRDLWTQTIVYPNNIQGAVVIDICLPDDYDENITYPVVYLTDSYWCRQNYGAIKELYQSGKTKEFILVGIGYPDNYDFDAFRKRDLLHKPDNFLNMIVKGIIPYVESKYKIDSKDRTFCGASYGGFFMIYSLLQSDGVTKDVFKNYILASPTLRESTGGIPLPDYEELYWNRTKILNANVYLAVGGTEDGYYFQTPIKNFVKRVKKRGYDGLNVTYKVYERKDHYTVWVPTLLDGLQKYLAK